jgi:6-pyruvoyltetrahydropterin/6-carboxytetrahydropterin synthase
MHVTLTQHFSFEAAHFLPYIPSTEGLGRVHGHSFAVEMHFVGEPDSQTGLVVNLETGMGPFRDLVQRLDHQLLNEVEGLGVPTLENLGAWLLRHGRAIDGRLNSVTVARPSVGQRCTVRMNGASA